MRAVLFLLPVLLNPVLGGRLPELDKKPWVGWYAASESRKFSFGVKFNGEGALIPMDGRDEMASVRKWIEFIPVVEEVLPGGKVVTKKTLDTGWEPITPSTTDAEQISYRGTTATGGAQFEVNFEIDGGEVRGGGRIVDTGELTENPLRFALRVRVQNVYSYKDAEEVEKIAKRDKIQIERMDGKKLKFDAFEPVWAEKDECNGPGVKTARVDLDGFEGSRLELDAGENGSFEMYNGSLRPLYKGVTFGWRSDPAKDPEGKGRFLVEFK